MEPFLQFAGNIVKTKAVFVFQSLFLWNPFFNEAYRGSWSYRQEFQSLFLWNPFFNFLLRSWNEKPKYVSILVFMEPFLQFWRWHQKYILILSFNPCFYGTLSSIFTQSVDDVIQRCFNPCFYGTLSSIGVILCKPWRKLSVSILVFMEPFLQLFCFSLLNATEPSFNPCFYGTLSSIPLTTVFIL